MIFQQVEAPERFDVNQARAATKPLLYDVPAAQGRSYRHGHRI
jgi:hypothetical protein